MNRLKLVAVVAAAIASLTSVSAHVVRGLTFPTLAVAFVSSPSAGDDAPIKVVWVRQTPGYESHASIQPIPRP